MNAAKRVVLTVGHSNHSFAVFLRLLKQHDVTALADVRSTPYSRFNPHFRREALARALQNHDIGYLFLGRELGARSKDPSCYEKGRVQYSRLAQTDLFRDGLARLLREADHDRIAVMCAEKEPLQCHRTLLVARHLVARGVAVDHILATGELEPNEATMERLLVGVKLPREDLLYSKRELIEQALALQEARIAYVDRKLAAEAQLPGDRQWIG